ncbi:MAG: hypothetical protein PVH68_14110 [Armatimonadota bacterium]|jgi:hypothetical protein
MPLSHLPRSVAAIAGVACLALPPPVSAQQLVREGAMAKLVLDGGEDVSAWAVAEATVTADPAHVKHGKTALRLAIPVDHHAGQPDYPIGWPRTNRPFGEPWQQDWSDFEFFSFWIYCATSRDALPREPLGLILYTPDKPRAYNRSLTELKKDEWVHIVIPLNQIPRHDNVTRIQFYIAESRYRDGDTLDFYVDDIALTRYAEPTIDAFAVGQRAIWADARWLPATFRMLGINAEQTAVAEFQVRRGDRIVATATRTVARGEQRVWIDLGRRPLPAGSCEVAARLQGGDARGWVTAPVRVVASPWQEAGK